VLILYSCRRVLLSKPRLVLMDESTSALDTANEASLYKALAAAGITFVSVGHRPSLVRLCHSPKSSPDCISRNVI